MIELEFIGAARTVTGSKHLLRTSRASVLLDCGMFQGRREESFEKNSHIPVDPKRLDAVVLSHAHIDHSGALPSLFKMGYRGPIYTTPATRDLTAPMLMDTAHLMKSDAEHIQRLIDRGEKRIRPVTPLYDQEDVYGTLSLILGLPYHRRQTIAPGIDLTFFDAGHVLGSAISVLDIEDEGKRLRIAYTGDLGRKHLPILRSPEAPEGISCLLMESTYGDRFHDPVELIGDALVEVILRTLRRGGKIVIPSFALERAQEVIYVLKKLRDQKRIPSIPVYVDSPLTVKLTDVFTLHPECYDPGTFALLHNSHTIFEFDELQYISSVEDSKRIDASPEPAIIISASGMCEGGRVLHHLHATIEDSKNTVLIVGFQAENTLGRRIVEKRPEVKIFGLPHRLEAEVCVLNGFSGHADQHGLLKFADAVGKRGPLERLILVHGDFSAQEALSVELKKAGVRSVETPRAGDRIRLG